jgi:SAM-dependent methyltransferase
MEDIPFYMEQAARTGGPILELACGTGRVTIPLAEAGHEIWGVDLSSEMLAVLEEKRSALPSEVRARLHLVHGDMSRFDLERRFSLIIIPFRGFQGLITRKQQEGCLRCVRDHLGPKGRFVIDVFKPYTVLNESWCQGAAFIREVTDSKTGCRIRFSDHRREIDVANQVIYPDLIFDIERPDGKVEQQIEPLALSYFYEDQIRALLNGAGLAVVEALSDYTGTPIGQGPEQLFVCVAN